MPHSTNGHGFIILDFPNPGAANTAATALARRAGVPAGTVIGSIDVMENPAGQPVPAPAGGPAVANRPQGVRMIIEVTTSDPIKSEQAHQKLLAAAAWAQGLAGNPGLPNHWCCYADQ